MDIYYNGLHNLSRGFKKFLLKELNFRETMINEIMNKRKELEIWLEEKYM